MQYPRNSSSPPPIHKALNEALSKLPITSGVSIYHTPGGGTQAPGANSPVHKGNGLWEYTPRQEETNYASFSILWYKDGHVAAESYIVTDSGSSGARTVDVTVDDGTNPLEGARIRLSINNGAQSYTRTTNVSGQASFCIDDGTWDLAITLSGYDFTPTTLVVDGDKSPTYSMTQVVTPDPDADTIKVVALCHGDDGEPLADVPHYLKQTSPAEATGHTYYKGERMETSGANGMVEFLGVFPGATYHFRRGTSRRGVEVTIPADANDPFELTSALGTP